MKINRGSILVSSKEKLIQTLSIFKVELIYPKIEESSDYYGLLSKSNISDRIDQDILVSERGLTLEENIILAGVKGIIILYI